MKSGVLKIYNIILWAILGIFSVLFMVYLANSFYTHEQDRINESMVSDLAWDLNDIKLRQLKILEGHNTYKVKRELILSNVSLNTHFIDDLPVTLMDLRKKSKKGTYYSDFRILVVPVTDKQVGELKVRFGLMKCTYLLMIFLVIWQVRKMLISVKNQSYFENQEFGNRMSWISLVLIFVPIFNLTFNYFLEHYLKNLSTIERFKFQKDFNFSTFLWIVAAVLCAIIAAIVSRGVKIKQEQDLTI